MRRLSQLFFGLVLFGFGCGLMVEAAIGLDPWTVFAQGIALRTGWGIGWITVLVGAIVLLLWIPLRQRPGIGTISNILLIGTSLQITVQLLPPVDHLGVRVLLFVAGLLLVALGSGLYIGANLGPGPRDGLMTGLSARFGWPIWVSRSAIELTVLVAGWLLGGNVGIGTVAYAVLIGPLVHLALPLFDTRPKESPVDDLPGAGAAPTAASATPTC